MVVARLQTARTYRKCYQHNKTHPECMKMSTPNISRAFKIAFLLSRVSLSQFLSQPNLLFRQLIVNADKQRHQGV